METFSIRNLTFTYPGKDEPALKDVSFDVDFGKFAVICGQSGSGKSTLLRNLKPVLAPHGKKTGQLLFYGKDIASLEHKTQAARIGYVLQDPDAQLVTDKVWHELAFGLESLGMDTKTIRLRVAEMASFFGIQSWFHKDVDHLSGGQKQLLNLAAVMAMQPDVLILDEPTAQLDPIAASDFLDTVKKINRELGTTVIITEHRLEEVIPMADQVIVMDSGSVIANDIPANVCAILAQKKHPMFMAMPTPLQAYATLFAEGVSRELECPVDVREGRQWLTQLLHDKDLTVTSLPVDEELPVESAPVIEVKDVWFKYERQSNDVIKDLSLSVNRGELFCIVGGNGTGKSTTLSLLSGIRKPYRGSVKINGRKFGKKDIALAGSVGMLPQNPQSLFVADTVLDDLKECCDDMTKIQEVAGLVRLSHLLDSHPYDLSGGEQQRAALAKVLLLEPEILLLDEPTKGLDNEFKSILAGILASLTGRGTTVVMVSHDIEFCGRYGDRCAMFFDGKIITTNAPRIFFSGNSFYTTAANRMSRHIFENAVVAEDVVSLVRRNLGKDDPDDDLQDIDGPDDEKSDDGEDDGGTAAKTDVVPEVEPAKPRKQGKQLILELAMWVMAAITTYAGLFAFESKHFMAVSVLLMIYTMVPFVAGFERRKPKAREIVIIAVFIAVAVAGRAVFFMLPNFKPMLAIVIIAGISLGKESGFLIGAMSVFVSNFLFGQGPWTPWQMIAMAFAGYLAGVIFHRYGDHLQSIPVIIFGGLTAFVLYGALTDLWTVFFMVETPSWEAIVTVYTSAVYFNLMHTAATAVFLAFLAKPMVKKMERIKVKFGMSVYVA